MLFWVILHQYPYPQPLRKFLFRFTLISRMVLGVGKKSEIRLKSEDSVPWAITLCCTRQSRAPIIAAARQKFDLDL